MNWFSWFKRAKPHTTSDKADEWRRSSSKLPLREYLSLTSGEYDMWLRMGYAPAVRSQEIIGTINELRNYHGIKPISNTKILPYLASWLTNYIALGQKIPFGIKNEPSLKIRLDRLSHSAENWAFLTAEQPTLAKAIEVWSGNHEHLGLLLDPDFTSVGACGTQYDSGRLIWCVVLTG